MSDRRIVPDTLPLKDAHFEVSCVDAMLTPVMLPPCVGAVPAVTAVVQRSWDIPDVVAPLIAKSELAMRQTTIKPNSIFILYTSH